MNWIKIEGYTIGWCFLGVYIVDEKGGVRYQTHTHTATIDAGDTSDEAIKACEAHFKMNEAVLLGRNY